MSTFTVISANDLVTATGGGAKLQSLVRSQQYKANTELRNAVCDNKGLEAGEDLARSLYGRRPSDDQAIAGINAATEFCKAQPFAPAGTPKLPR
jgi:hypothetical protein